MVFITRNLFNFTPVDPQSLYDLVHSFTFKATLTKKIIFEFFLAIQQSLYQTICLSTIITFALGNARIISLLKTKNELNVLPLPALLIPRLIRLIWALLWIRLLYLPPRIPPPDIRLCLGFQTPRPPIPLWVVLITSNYLHSGGWTDFLG